VDADLLTGHHGRSVATTGGVRPAIAEEAPGSGGDRVTTLTDNGEESNSNDITDGTHSATSGFFETVSPAVFSDRVDQQLLPWGDGFLHIVLPPPGAPEEACYVDQLWTRFSTNGVEWTEFSYLEIPDVHSRPTPPLGQDDDYSCWTDNFSRSVHISSDGAHLAIASQWPISAVTYPGYTARNLELLDQLLENPPLIFLSITTDLVNWETLELPIPRPAGLHDSLQAASRLVDLSLDDQGWLLVLETAKYMNLLSLMPEDIRESAAEVRPTHDAPWYDESSGERGMSVDWRTAETPYGEYPYTRFVPWSELGTTSDLYDTYGSVPMKPYLQPWHFSRSMLTASWGHNPSQFELPDHAKYGNSCCQVVRTESGYVGLSDHSLAGYDPARFGPADIEFSPDGETWEYRGPITEPRMWVRAIYAVKGGIVAHSSPSDTHVGTGGWASSIGGCDRGQCRRCGVSPSRGVCGAWC
jgi:hypothetical protein